MVDRHRESSVYLYEYGEAYDDLRPAFFIDERSYSDREMAESVVESAEAAMTRAGVIYEVEVTSGVHAERPIGVPTWEEFKQRHFVEGVPLPVRPPMREQALPPSWPEMTRAVEEAHENFRAYLIQLLTGAFPGQDVSLSSDPGPLRRSPGSVDWSEERFGFEVTVVAGIGDLPPAAALARVSAILVPEGWELGDPVSRPTSVALSASRDLFGLWIDARPLRLTVLGQSPLYRAPGDSGPSYLVEPR
ncbi:hypothetical protein GCM10020358_73210 [Amorphoplanes nipponensis]|uniref:Uncharacterized protein n=1 Tax=Actinoplanes nipponensis TaxID=135950 RepID=A0A919JFH0_9ACTN|nr:hypothetical protein [Actinoplanes nipponensis]GIE49738.1 hypothetical protein Ani05nite_32720 [Actinoplanes nipponensis]